MASLCEQPQLYVAEPARVRPITASVQMAQKVIVRDAGTEIHGYVVARKGQRVLVVWAVASGRHRYRTFRAAVVSPHGDDHGWDGYLIPLEYLGVSDHAAR